MSEFIDEGETVQPDPTMDQRLGNLVLQKGLQFDIDMNYAALGPLLPLDFPTQLAPPMTLSAYQGIRGPFANIKVDYNRLNSEYNDANRTNSFLVGTNDVPPIHQGLYSCWHSIFTLPLVLTPISGTGNGQIQGFPMNLECYMQKVNRLVTLYIPPIIWTALGSSVATQTNFRLGSNADVPLPPMYPDNSVPSSSYPYVAWTKGFLNSPVNSGEGTIVDISVALESNGLMVISPGPPGSTWVYFPTSGQTTYGGIPNGIVITYITNY